MIKRYFPLLSLVPVAPCVHSGITNDDSAKSFSIICLIYPFLIIKKNAFFFIIKNGYIKQIIEKLFAESSFVIPL